MRNQSIKNIKGTTKKCLGSPTTRPRLCMGPILWTLHLADRYWRIRATTYLPSSFIPEALRVLTTHCCLPTPTWTNQTCHNNPPYPPSHHCTPAASNASMGQVVLASTSFLICSSTSLSSLDNCFQWFLPSNTVLSSQQALSYLFFAYVSPISSCEKKTIHTNVFFGTITTSKGITRLVRK